MHRRSIKPQISRYVHESRTPRPAVIGEAYLDDVELEVVSDQARFLLRSGASELPFPFIDILSHARSAFRRKAVDRHIDQRLKSPIWAGNIGGVIGRKIGRSFCVDNDEYHFAHVLVSG